MAEKSQAETDYETVVANAKRLKLTGRDRDDYIHKHMTGYGYKSRRTYFQPEEDESSGGGFFGNRSRRDRDDEDDD